MGKPNPVSASTETDSYFDVRNLASPMGAVGSCPVSGCTAPLLEAESQWGRMPYCPVHRIRIHKKTFVYYNGPDKASKRDAALRNILFERDYFKEHILGNAAKAETHRICHETSEDALSWNVFSRLARGGLLPKIFSTLTQSSVKNDPELYMWGLKVRLDDSCGPTLFPALSCARDIFEKGIKKFLTEPDIMLYVPGQCLLLVEAKFTQGNTIASTSPIHDVAGEKPKSREGTLRRYSPAALPRGALIAPSHINDRAQESIDKTSQTPFYSQLYRNLVFAIYMANKLDVRWGLVNLVCKGQFHQRPEFQDPTQFIHALLPKKSRHQFLFYSWERLYADHVANAKELKDLAEYIYNKSANGVKALAV
jgi:hypothetical protein